MIFIKDILKSSLSFLLCFIIILILLFRIGIKVFEYYNAIMLKMPDSDYNKGDLQDDNL